MKLTIAQLNPTIGDIDGNLAGARWAIDRATADGSDLVVLPELYVTGYPPRDLLERPRFIDQARQALETLREWSAELPGPGILVGTPTINPGAAGHGLYNSAVLLHQGRIVATQHKSLLPTYDVFDEARYFDSAPDVAPVDFKWERLGIAVCEDAWNDPKLWHRRQYPFDPIETLAARGATIIINISASPFHVGKDGLRFRILSACAARYGLPVVMVNQVGGNDELIFDGRSMAVDSGGNLVAVLPGCREAITTVDTAAPGTGGYDPPAEAAAVHEALVLGLRDYMRKCGFSRAVLGLSGGIDSAVVCCLAAEAIGPQNVLGVAMPSPYSSEGSIVDARALAENLGIQFTVIPIETIFSSFLDGLAGAFTGTAPDLTEENIQARIRGTLLMGLSNKFNRLLLATGNKSEVAVGYCTLYGDMCGGLAVISDVPKTMVYELARYINRDRERIPRATIEKPPSAELRPGQTDQDSLPPYDVLDRILHHYVDEGRSLPELRDMDFNPETLRAVIKLIDRSEYKRRQAAPGLKVTSKAFGMGRRMAIAARYEH